MAIIPEDVRKALEDTPPFAPKAAAPSPSSLPGNDWIAEAEAQSPAQPSSPAAPSSLRGDGSGSAQQPPANEEGADGAQQQPTNEILSPKEQDTRALIPHVPVFSLDRLRALRARLGDGLNLGIKFFVREGAPEKDEYKESPDPLIFKGINILTARTSGGKTLLLKSLCARILDLKQDFHAVFISLEEGESAIEEALLAGYLWNKEAFPWLPGSGETPRQIEAITVKQIHDYTKFKDALQSSEYTNKKDALQYSDTIRLDNAAHDLGERLHVITIENLEEAALAFAGGLEEKHRAVFEADPPRADYSDTIRALILAYQKQFAGKVVFFIDYAQRIHHKDGPGNASYKELQAVMHDLMFTARAGAVVFLAAQSNRTVATGSAAGYAEKGASREAAEYFNVYGEQLREAADLEQAAEMIIYSTIDRYNNTLNLRLTKYRGGNRDQFAAIPIFWGVQCARLDEKKVTAPTLKHAPEKPKGTGGKGRNYTGDIMGSSSPAKENDEFEGVF